MIINTKTLSNDFIENEVLLETVMYRLCEIVNKLIHEIIKRITYIDSIRSIISYCFIYNLLFAYACVVYLFFIRIYYISILKRFGMILKTIPTNMSDTSHFPIYANKFYFLWIQCLMIRLYLIKALFSIDDLIL